MKILNNPTIHHIHFIGIGGIGMSGLAEMLLHSGNYTISGSDQNTGVIINRLKQLGATIYQGHQAEQLQGADAVVYSSAINEKNPEFLLAKQKGLPLIPRGQLLSEFLRDRKGIAIAGTHGKTTTSGLISMLMTTAEYDPSYIIGGYLRGNQSTIRFGKGKDIVVEADESDGSFLFLKPHVVVVTNIEADHLENYHDDFNCLKNTFVNFINHVEQDGVAILCIDDPIIRELLPKISANVRTYGFSEDADILAENFQQTGLKSQFHLLRKGHASIEVKLNLPGKHNIQNALAAVAIAQEYGIADELLLKALQQFPGMGRRFHPCGEILLEKGKALIFSDYGHHPTEIKATLNAARLAWPGQRIVMAFQPHRYSRTQALMEEFVKVLSEADVLLLLQIYGGPGEQPIPGVSSEVLYQALSQHSAKKLQLVPSLAELPKALHNLIKENDIVLMQGAGDIESIIPKLT